MEGSIAPPEPLPCGDVLKLAPDVTVIVWCEGICMNVIEVENLEKVFGGRLAEKVHALRGVDLQVAAAKRSASSGPMAPARRL